MSINSVSVAPYLTLLKKKMAANNLSSNSTLNTQMENNA
jgi:hypothetical protein